MKRIALRLLAFSSAALLVWQAQASTRPHYGGTLRVVMHVAINTLDPANTQADRLTRLVFDTLVIADDAGRLQPSLARAWSSDATFHRWQLWLRRGVKFHDGELFTPDIAAVSLANFEAGCKTSAVGDSVVFECDAPKPALAAQLALPAAAIVRRTATGKLEGTGPFLMSEWQPGRRAVFTAFEESWAGRPYVDAVEVTLGQGYREQALALQLGRADVADLAPGQAVGTGRVSTSAPADLVALVFSPGAASVADPRVRQALSLAIDRVTIAEVLLQKQAQPAGGILPNWITGYEFLFSVPHEVARARHLRGEARATNPISIAVSGNDTQLQLIAERIALNARDAGFTVQLTTNTAHADAVLAQVELGSVDPEAALANVAAQLHRGAPEFRDDTIDAAQHAERAMLAENWIVPVVHLQRAVGLGAKVRNWFERRDSAWRLDEVWVNETPPAGARP